MRSARFGLIICLLSLNISARGQQSQPATTTSSAPKDPQAVTVLNQALTVAGGTTALASVLDYAASGNVTYPSSQSGAITGTFTIKVRGLNQFRVDEVLPAGADSQSINNGIVRVKTPSGAVQLLLNATPAMVGATGIPWLQLTALATDPNVVLIYKGTVTQGNASVYDIVAKRTFPTQTWPNGPFLELGNAEFFIDTSTFQLVSAQDTIIGGAIRSIQYSDYKVFNGIAVPLSVTEQVGSTVTRQMQFSQISFNNGLQDSAFDLSQ